jgi:hypothetical protein
MNLSIFFSFSSTWRIFIDNLDDFYPSSWWTVFGERTGRLVVEQHIVTVHTLTLQSDRCRTISPLRPDKKLVFKINFHFHFELFQKFISLTYDIRFEWFLHCWISLTKIYKLSSV